MKNFNPNTIMNGTFGDVWVNNVKFMEIKSFEAKATGEYEDVNIQGSLGKARKYMGFDGSGTMVCHKVYSRGLSLLAEGFRTGKLPEIKMISKLEDPSALGAERIVYYGVTFDEITLAKFESKAVGEEELPFKFEDFETIDLV